MNVTLTFPCGMLGNLEIETNTEHGNPDVVKLNGVDISDQGPFIDFVMLQLGEKYTERLNRASLSVSQLVGKIG